MSGNIEKFLGKQKCWGQVQLHLPQTKAIICQSEGDLLVAHTDEAANKEPYFLQVEKGGGDSTEK